MPTARIMLLSALLGNGPALPSGDIVEPAHAELLAGAWEGTWGHEDTTDVCVLLHKSILTI